MVILMLPETTPLVRLVSYCLSIYTHTQLTYSPSVGHVSAVGLGSTASARGVKKCEACPKKSPTKARSSGWECVRELDPMHQSIDSGTFALLSMRGWQAARGRRDDVQEGVMTQTPINDGFKRDIISIAKRQNRAVAPVALYGVPPHEMACQWFLVHSFVCCHLAEQLSRWQLQPQKEILQFLFG